ncbi:hypothetical protein AVEN_149945-1 [Araneus ventricosus]|uniref:Uncharacterized protein n=1 Tax=Araneus ventricosus TaxID=182803 RepID=A0A4Y2LBG0_ARAVE|nr:hypothetical protein AVEN_149945-1 [Araneus ventricosus]
MTSISPHTSSMMLGPNRYKVPQVDPWLIKSSQAYNSLALKLRLSPVIRLTLLQLNHIIKHLQPGLFEKSKADAIIPNEKNLFETMMYLYCILISQM